MASIWPSPEFRGEVLNLYIDCQILRERAKNARGRRGGSDARGFSEASSELYQKYIAATEGREDIRKRCQDVWYRYWVRYYVVKEM